MLQQYSPLMLQYVAAVFTTDVGHVAAVFTTDAPSK